jgi:pilus assembly protein Flp/PilA
MLTQLFFFVKSYLSTFDNEEGQGMAEYALIIALVAILLVGALTSLKGGISDVFGDIVNGFDGISPTSGTGSN